MSRSILATVLMMLVVGLGSASAQENGLVVPADRQVKQLPRQKLSGPRFGFTAFTGETADMRSQADMEPMMTQFGWQFETQIVSLSDGNQALMEWVVLVGGVEQDEFNTSLAWLAGYRLANGLEFGVGPNVSFNPDQEKVTTSMQVAGGATIPFGDMYIPVNLSVGIAEGGPRFTTLIGWIVG